MEIMKDRIIEMANKNIGSLCLFLKNKLNIGYFNLLNKSIPELALDRPLSEKIWYFVNEKKDIQLCDCGKHLSFIGFKNGYRTSCGDKECFVKNRRKTCMEKYGVDNPKKDKNVQLKQKENIEKKWGGKHYMHDKDVREKFNKTMLKKHGVEWPQQSKDISSKSSLTFSLNPNKEFIIKSRVNAQISKSEGEKSKILEKKLFVLEGVSEVFESNGKSSQYYTEEMFKKQVDLYKSNIIQKIIEVLPNDINYIDKTSDSKILLSCDKCTNSFKINQQLLKNRIERNSEICLICNPIFPENNQSINEVFSFVEGKYNGNISLNETSVIPGLNIDIYIEELKIGIKFNSLGKYLDEYKSRAFHLNQTKICTDKGIHLIHIWEDDWIYKQEIVKSIISNKIGNSDKIYARKCEVKEVIDNKLIKDFLVKNHIQGFVGSKVKIGLFYNDELVSMMNFGSLRTSLGQKNIEGSYELLRFCNKLNLSVVGGASKIFKFFLETFKPIEITSYSDNSRNIGDMYYHLGFKLIHNSDPNYYWVIDGIRYHRFNFRKDKLIREGADPNKTEIQIMTERGSFRVFDSGCKKFLYKSSN